MTFCLMGGLLIMTYITKLHILRKNTKMVFCNFQKSWKLQNSNCLPRRCWITLQTIWRTFAKGKRSIKIILVKQLGAMVFWSFLKYARRLIYLRFWLVLLSRKRDKRLLTTKQNINIMYIYLCYQWTKKNALAQN